MTDEAACKKALKTNQEPHPQAEPLSNSRQPETSLFRLSRKILTLNAILKRNIRELESIDAQWASQIVGLLNLCVAELIDISRLPNSPLWEITTEVLQGYDSTYYRKVVSPTVVNRDSALNLLTKRELQVLQSLTSGKSNKEVAAALDISFRTVETYRARIMQKLDKHSMGQLVRFAIGHGILKL